MAAVGGLEPRRNLDLASDLNPYIHADDPVSVATRYRRSPRDIIRLVAFVALSLIAIALSIWVNDAIVGFESDLIRLVDFLPTAVGRILHGALEWALVTIGALSLLVPLVTRRFRLTGYVAAAMALGFGLMWAVQLLIDRETPAVLVNRLAARAGVTDSTTIGVDAFAALTAVLIVFGPFVTRPWRTAGRLILVLLVAIRVLVSYRLPSTVFTALPIGAAAGAAVLLVLGRPDHRPTIAAIRSALATAGLDATSVVAAPTPTRAATPYLATLADGSPLLVKLFGEEERASDTLFRAARLLRLKNVGDHRPFSSLRRTVEHETLVSLFARASGVRTPALRTMVPAHPDALLLAFDFVGGTRLGELPTDALTDDVLRAVVTQFGILRDHRIAHRDIHRDCILLDPAGDVWIINFGLAELAVEPTVLDADVAQLLATLALLSDPERAVRVSIEVLGRDVVAGALPRMQLRAMANTTQDALKDHKDLLAELLQEVQTQTGVDEIQYAELARFNTKTVFTAAILVAATYFLFPQFADLPAIVDQVQAANWWWAPVVVTMSLFTYIGAGMSTAGGVPDHVRAGPVTLNQVAAEFASTLAPAGIGGMALNVRFLQKQGVDRAVAVTGIGLSTVAGIVAHISLIGVFVVWAGRNAFGSVQLPDWRVFVIGAGVVVALAGIGFAIPATRTLIVNRLLPIVRRGVGGISQVLHRPGKLALLLLGSTMLSLGYLFCLYFSVRAFGGGMSLASVGAVYLVGSALANAAPTPGGLGAMEAALISGLVAAGLANDAAVPAVFLFRLATFWLPILPGWLSLHWLQRNDYL